MTSPKYEIGDRLPGTEIYIRGRTTVSNGSTRYFLQAGDYTFVFESQDLEEIVVMAQYLKQPPDEIATDERSKRYI